jgi:hypothetical protein
MRRGNSSDDFLRARSVQIGCVKAFSCPSMRRIVPTHFSLPPSGAHAGMLSHCSNGVEYG